MKGTSPPECAELIDKLRLVTATGPGDLHRPEIAVQDAVNVLLAHIRAVSASAESDEDAAARLSRQIRALHIPLTEMLALRLTSLEPALPGGQAKFAAAADARMIIRTALLSFRR